MKNKLLILILLFAPKILFAQLEYITYGGLNISLIKFSTGEINIENQNQIDSINHLISQKKEDFIFLSIWDINQESINKIFQNINDTSRIIGVAFINHHLKILPSSLQNRFPNICSLIFDGCDSLESFNNFIGKKCSSLQILFSFCNFKRFPDGIENICVPIDLNIDTYCNREKFDYETEFKRFLRKKNLIFLTISDERFTEFPECFFDFISLTGLQIGSSKLSYIPDKFDKLPNLIFLGIYCINLKNKKFKTLENRSELKVDIF